MSSRSVQRMFCVLTLSLNVGVQQVSVTFAALGGSIYPAGSLCKSNFGRQQAQEHSDVSPFFDGDGTWNKASFPRSF